LYQDIIWKIKKTINMNVENTPVPYPAEKKPMDILRQFVSLFERKGWLNKDIRIKRRNKRYRISCSRTEFFAYRVNENCGLSPGIPGWPVCIVKHDKIINDYEMTAFTSSEPTADEWLRCITDDDFELIGKV
jgi:hypothetical protein